MNKTKLNFIADLLAQKNISASVKERLLLLVKKELKLMSEKDDTQIKKILERIEKLENPQKDIESTHLSNKQEKPSVLANPKDVASFMALFNQRDGFKYFTHDYDEVGDFEINDFLFSRYQLFKEVTSKKVKIPRDLWAIMNQFAFESKHPVWKTISQDYKSSIPVKVGWSSKELVAWSVQNKLHPIRNEKYKDMINDFRRITRIESPNLDTLIKNTMEKVFSNERNSFEIDLKNLSKADFYTHVSSLKTALETVFEEIKKRADEITKRKIKVEYQRETEDDFFVRKILITHYNSFPTKELPVLLKEWTASEKGSMGKIAENMQGYCYWSVITRIEGIPTKVNILKNDDMPNDERVTDLESVGFTHIFTFYYK